MAADDSKELRLALVCYGGVSLAVYMHGVTKELHKLVIASERLNEACQDVAQPPKESDNPFQDGQTERAYWSALRELMQSTGVRTRVVIDIVSGASAGGINGILLSKALTQNLDQDSARELWMGRGDLWRLLRGPKAFWALVTAGGGVGGVAVLVVAVAVAGGGLVRFVLGSPTLAWHAALALGTLVAACVAVRAPTPLRGTLLALVAAAAAGASVAVATGAAAVAGRGRWPGIGPGVGLALGVLAGVVARWRGARRSARRKPAKALLDGPRTLDSMMKGLEGLGAAPPERGSLMPDGHDLDLSVAVTDLYGYPVRLSLADGKKVLEMRHRHTIRFRYGPDTDQFDRDHNGILAFAARATSSFPGAFPPIRLRDLGKRGRLRQATIERTFFRERDLSGADFEEMWLVDGGVVDNRPFGPAIRAIQQRAASREVDRRLAYIDPHPERMRDADGASDPPGTPTWAYTVSQSLSGLPRHEPIVEDLADIRRHNARVGEVERLVATNWVAVADLVARVRPQAPEDDPTPDVSMTQRQDTMHRLAQNLVRLAYGDYVAMKVRHSVWQTADLMAEVCEYPEASEHALFVRDVMQAWAPTHGIMGAESWRQRGPRVRRFLRRFDGDYAGRRIRFVLRRLSRRYGGAGDSEQGEDASRLTRADIDGAKGAFHALAERVAEVYRASRLPSDLKGEITAVFGVDAVRDAELPTQDAELPTRDAELSTVEEFEARFRPNLDDVVDSLGQHFDGAFAELAARLHADFHDAIGEHLGADITVANESMDAYLGFPVWDALTFPAMHVADIRELSEVQVMRFSPNDADELRQGGAEQKLRGIRYGHFGAFMKRAWRENDYLWGRLDGVEHALKLLNPPGGRLSAAALQHASVGWRAVLKNEDGRLPRIRREMAEIRDEIP